MTEWIGQRICIKVCQKLTHTQAETIKKIKRPFGDDGMGETQSKEWYYCLYDRHTYVESNKHSSRPSTSRNPKKIKKVDNLVVEKRQIMFERSKMKWELHTVSCRWFWHTIWTCIALWKNLSQNSWHASSKKSILRLPETSWNVLTMNQTQKNKIIIGDESWDYGSYSNGRYRSPRPKKVQSKVKVILIVLLTIRAWFIMSTLLMVKMSTKSMYV